MSDYIKVEDVGGDWRCWIIKCIDVLAAFRGLQILDKPVIVNEATDGEVNQFILSGSRHIFQVHN